MIPIPACTCRSEWKPDPLCPLALYLKAKEAAALDLWRDKQITRWEMFRHEVDTATHQTTGPITTTPAR